MIIAIGNIIGKSGGFRTDGNVPVNTIAPVISGTALVGNTLTSTTGTWTSDTGVIGYLYQWTRDGVNISGATNSTYTLVNADLNTNIICKVAATDTDGTSAYVNSNGLLERTVEDFKSRVAADGGSFEAESCLKTQLESLNLTYPVTFVSSPLISGSTSVGSTITTTNGVFNGITPITYTYQWLLNGNPISGATNATYTVTGFDNGTLTCRVTGTNIYGAVFSISNQLTINNVFEFTINTNNTSTGSTANNQFALPLVSSLPLNAFVDWGDGSTDIITTFNQSQRTHTYSSAGTYTIKITGALSGWQFANTGDRLKILNISKWSGLTISTGNGFRGCSNMTCSATDTPRIATTDMQSYFRSCANFNGAIGNWNVSGVSTFTNMFLSAVNFNQPLNWNMSSATNIGSMFSVAFAFNQDIGDWNISNVTSAVDFMFGKTPATFSSSNLDAIYNGWSSRPVKPNINITFGTAKYTAAGQAGKNILTGAPNNWTCTDGGI